MDIASFRSSTSCLLVPRLRAASATHTTSNLRHNTNAYKRRADAITQKPKIAFRSCFAPPLTLISKPNTCSWIPGFTTEPFICRSHDPGLEVIGMPKDNKQQYWYKGRLYNLKGLAKIAIRHCPQGNCRGPLLSKRSICAASCQAGLSANCNKKDEYIILLTTAVTLPDSEAVRIYGYRWGIEVCFRACKSLLKLGKEFQGLSYDVTDSTTALVLTRFLILEYISVAGRMIPRPSASCSSSAVMTFRYSSEAVD